ncbi:uncharacterized protein C1orf194 homolog [Acanthaster planci]|uniref:Uncharacterized protein C1orf194 homolog n=1 Tax=Acanthaster planci TaxID=133434 RepID=A0A8B7XLE3_ACAPL|nr:uncharacterized protein C1orf194 homolog [Acanthaster planci]
MEVSNRQPYPFPELQNDDDFMGARTFQTKSYTQPTHLAQRVDPWNRLNTTSTLSSSRREVYHHDPQAPRDSLDFILKSDYDQHNEFLRSKNETLTQPETIGEDHGRILKNKKKEEPKLFDPMNPPTVKSVIQDPKKESIHSTKGAIDSHHSAATNPGYSRKHDGGFYTT